MTTFVDLLQEHGIPYHEGDRFTRPGWINLRCPECDKDPYLGYNLAGRYTTCWYCGYIPLWGVLQYITEKSPGECFELVNQLPRTYTREIIKTGKLVYPEGVGHLSLFHQEYLRDRYFSPWKISKDWEVRGIGQHGGRFRWRLFIPIHYYGEVVSWTTRSIGNREPRYLSAKHEQSAIPIENLLYGVDHTRGSVIVCEGPVDVWRIGYGAVALLGVNASSAQMEQLSRFPMRYVCFDKESKAQSRARQLCNDLSVHEGKTENIVLQSGKDPGDASEKEIKELQQLLV